MINKDKIKGFLVGIVVTSLLCGTVFAAPIIKNVSIVYDNIKRNLIEKYTNVIVATFEKQNKIEFENQQLSELRDWLLPMLINGQVQVK